mmetsp:Transcript_45480/g.105457  ORF Transcript_45480/g.105457 Transcript_45480/m.105457 type:complete len:247 (-) Transcript_45480:44-784(-)
MLRSTAIARLSQTWAPRRVNSAVLLSARATQCLPEGTSSGSIASPWCSISTRSFAVRMKPQELHKHRKRLDGFGKDAGKGDSEILAKCRQLLGDQDWYSRKVAVDTLAKVSVKGSKEELRELYKHLEDEDIFVREAAVDAVAEVASQGDDEAIARLAAKLVDEDCFVRTRAVVAMGELCNPGDTGAVSLLDDMFEDGFVPVRKKTIEVLTKLAPTEAMVKQRLEKCLSDIDSGVRLDAKEALSKFG